MKNVHNFRVMRWWCCSQYSTLWNIMYIQHWNTNWWYLIKSGNKLNCLYFCSFSILFSAFVHSFFISSFLSSSLYLFICNAFIDDFKFIYCYRSSPLNEYCTNNKYLYSQRKTTELHLGTHFHFSIWKSNSQRMENIEGKKAYAQIHKYLNTLMRAHIHKTQHTTHMYSTQNDKTIFEIFLRLFVKDILVDIRNDTIVYIDSSRMMGRKACNGKGYI